ncbi:hypothetical protein TNCV_2017281 [Trichonephila clavipes]|nr:hypothetical protein TNCV_2017281 [Trichonephila clavipes]
MQNLGLDRFDVLQLLYASEPGSKLRIDRYHAGHQFPMSQYLLVLIKVEISLIVEVPGEMCRLRHLTRLKLRSPLPKALEQLNIAKLIFTHSLILKTAGSIVNNPQVASKSDHDSRVVMVTNSLLTKHEFEPWYH